MRVELLRGMQTVIEKRGVKREELNLGIVGPGLNPVNCELDRRFIMEQLIGINSIVLIDFSQKVLAEAASQLEHEGIPREKIFKMQYDITNGMSTVYRNFIMEMLSSVQSFDELRGVAEQLAQVNINNLRCRLAEDKDKAEQASTRPMTQSLIGGGENKDRTLKLTVEGEPLPLHLVGYQMVLAGTGASAEDRFWSTYHEALERQAGITSNIQSQQREIFEQIFTLIGSFNTAISITSIRDMLRDNPDAYITAVTDISTVSKSQGHTFDRLDKRKLQCELAKGPMPIHTSIPSASWEWEDEDTHSHEIKDFIFTH